MTSEDPRDPRSHAIIGAAMEVHTHLGCGFAEPVYQEAMAIEMALRDIPYEPQVDVRLEYKGWELTARYRPDFVCYDGVVVELKAISSLGRTEEAQLINYLKATKLKVGLLLNFGARSLEFRRFVN